MLDPEARTDCEDDDCDAMTLAEVSDVANAEETSVEGAGEVDAMTPVAVGVVIGETSLLEAIRLEGVAFDETEDVLLGRAELTGAEIACEIDGEPAEVADGVVNAVKPVKPTTETSREAVAPAETHGQVRPAMEGPEYV